MAATGHFLTFSVTRLELQCKNQQLSVATGFFLKKDSDWFLITNWHVLAGRNPINGQPLHASGAVPDVCRFFAAEKKLGAVVWKSFTTSLGNPLNGTATWYQHPSEGQRIDIASLPIQANEIGVAKNMLDGTGHDPDMFIDLGDDLFLPGYPLGVSADGFLPIWKRASLASSLEMGQGLNRFFYVDTATREGMSGSPCLAISNWRHYSLDRASNKMNQVHRPMSWRLLGVYSGRKTQAILLKHKLA